MKVGRKNVRQTYDRYDALALCWYDKEVWYGIRMNEYV
jgi:hypothetical protein